MLTQNEGRTMRRTQTFMLCFSMLLCSSTALATVDISTLDKVEVGSWGDLKDALSDSANANKAIVLTGNITADVDNPIDMVAGKGMVIDGKGIPSPAKKALLMGNLSILMNMIRPI